MNKAAFYREPRLAPPHTHIGKEKGELVSVHGLEESINHLKAPLQMKTPRDAGTVQRDTGQGTVTHRPGSTIPSPGSWELCFLLLASLKRISELLLGDMQK